MLGMLHADDADVPYPGHFIYQICHYDPDRISMHVVIYGNGTADAVTEDGLGMLALVARYVYLSRVQFPRFEQQCVLQV